MTLDDKTRTTYLERIDAAEPPRRDLEGLRALQSQHVLSVPFENLDCYCRRPLELGSAAVDKIAHRGRGGGCYEQNSAFGLLLSSLGYSVTTLAARVYHGNELRHPMRHLVLLVELTEPYLVDVAFGFGNDRNPRRPLRFNERSAQADPHGNYRLHEAPNGDVDLVRDGTPMYRLERHPRETEDFELALWWFHTSPESPMLQAMFCLLPGENGRVALKNRKLTRITGEHKSSSELRDVNQVIASLDEHFGISLPGIPDFGKSRDELAAIMAAEITRPEES